MSDFVSNLGTFKPSTFSGDKPKRRMAGDYLSEFTQRYSDNSQQKQVNNRKDFNTSQSNNGKSYGTNTEKMLFGNSAPKQTTAVADEPTANSNANSSNVSSQASTPAPSGRTLKNGQPAAPQPSTPQMKSMPAQTDKMGNRLAQSATSGMTEGQKMAQNVRPEYAKQAAEFYDRTNEQFGDRPELMGNILTHMGGDLFLPDPEKVKAKWKKDYADRPELLSNIMAYMGGGAGKTGHNR